MARSKPRRNYQTTGFFIGAVDQIAVKRRAELQQRGIPDAVLRTIEFELKILKAETATAPPTPAEMLAAIDALRAKTSDLVTAWAETDAATKQELRRRCDILRPDPDRHGVNEFEAILDQVMAAIYATEVVIKRWPKPTGSEYDKRVAAIVRRSLKGADLVFDTKPSGLATLVLGALLTPPDCECYVDVRYLIKQELARCKTRA